MGEMTEEELKAIRLEVEEFFVSGNPLTPHWQLNVKLLDEVEYLRAALKFYADSNTYIGSYIVQTDNCIDFGTVPILEDEGKRAREALGEE